jgi:hypothetical protein
MEEAVKAGRPEWGSFDFPELKGEFENFNDSQFREKIASAMEAREIKSTIEVHGRNVDTLFNVPLLRSVHLQKPF